jgi:mono/diheme cytochrome c family protein
MMSVSKCAEAFLPLACLLWLALSATAAGAVQAPFSTIQRGKYLVDAGDCMACHTSEADKPFAGGYPVETPFGTIYSANITPDRQSGIGAWSEEDFWRAMHFGVRPNGDRLYPAFPYPSFTKLTRDDVDAMHAYLATLKPERNTPPANDLTWPLNHRVFMRGWNMLFFTPGEFRRNPAKSDEWNRGAYLVEGPGHCGACHTAKNAFGGDKESRFLQGGGIQSWFAPQIANGARNGLQAWSEDDIVEYLKTGRNRMTGATGLMAEVITYSTSQLSDDDLRAIAAYLKDVAGGDEPKHEIPHQSVMAAGKAVFDDSCAACHRTSGEGVERMFPPLKGNANVQSREPTTVIRVILDGARTVATDKQPTPSSMPSYDWKLTDSEIAAVATYVRNAWGNSASPVDADDVKALRKDLRSKDLQAIAR